MGKLPARRRGPSRNLKEWNYLDSGKEVHMEEGVNGGDCT